MTNKRFVYGMEVAINSDELLPVITDTKTEKNYYRFVDVVGLLNEQQDTISQLKEENEQLKSERPFLFVEQGLKKAKAEYKLEKLKEENEQLRQQLKWKREEIKTLIEEDGGDGV